MLSHRKFRQIAVNQSCTEHTHDEAHHRGVIAHGILGGLAGAQLGSGSGQVVAAAIGTVIGAILGANTGRELDRADQLLEQRLQQSRVQVPAFGLATFDLPSSSPTPSASSSVRRESLFENHPAGCRKLDGGFRAAFACRDDIGRWFVLQ